VVSLWCSFGLGNLGAAEDRPNLVFLLVDDLGIRDLGCYGSTFHESPNIDRLAREGMRFSNAYASHAVCGPSRQAIMTGRTPARLGVTGIAGKLRSGEVVWPQRLQQTGYQTWFVGKWHLGPHDSVTKFGFDRNIAGFKEGQPADYYFPYKADGKLAIFNVPDMEDGKPGDYLTDALTTKALRLLEQREKKRPFLLYFSFYQVHKPAIEAVWAQGKKEYAAEFRAKLSEHPLRGPATRVVRHGAAETTETLIQRNPDFAAQIKSLDENVGRIMGKLEELSLTENTIVILTSDQGSVVHGAQAVSSAQPYQLGKQWLFEGGIRVPLIVRWPGRIAAGRNSELRTFNTDLFPTILDLLRLPQRPDAAEDGISIAPELRGHGMASGRPYYWVYPLLREESRPHIAYRHDDLKLVYWYRDGLCELFDLATDPGELNDLSQTRPDALGDMLRAIQQPSPLHDFLIRQKAVLPSAAAGTGKS
jgi:arylsulfatase A-like enzyme